MKYILWLATLLGTLNVTAFAQQNDPVAIVVNGRPIHKSEFEISYKKNNDLTDNSKESFEDFLKSYVDYQLAVEEAYSQKLDTMSDFQYQRSTFRSSIAAPYMQEGTALMDSYITRLKEYLEQDVEINHTLIPFEKENVLPTDTLAAYKKAMAVYSKLKKTGFVGDEYKNNTLNPSAVYDHSLLNGYIGWVTPSMFPSKVVDAMYTLPTGEVSRPIRTIKGYHIIQILGRRPAVGKLQVDHIYFAFPQIPATQKQVDSVMLATKELMATPGVTFDALCVAYADAYGLKNGCAFDPFGLDGQLPASLMSEAYKIKKPGDLSSLVVTDLGVHLMRLVGEVPPMTDDQQLAEIKKMIGSKDWWYRLALENQKALFEKYNLRINADVYGWIKTIAEKVFPNDSTFIPLVKNQDDILLAIDDTVKISVGRFVAHLKGQVKNEEKKEYEEAMSKFFGAKTEESFNLSVEQLDWELGQFAARILQAYVFETLEKRHPEMVSRINEFAGGLLAYEAKDRNVYRKASLDVEGLERFFEANKNKYQWDQPRFVGYVIRCSDEKSYNLVKKTIDSAKADVNLITLINQIFEKSSLSKPDVEKGFWLEGENSTVDRTFFKKKNAVKDQFVVLKGRVMTQPEKVAEVGGSLIADYQDFLEKEWIEGLRAKYEVVVNKEVLEDIK
ncbi:peptidylprolyl isomerase [Dysgonomonas massiliensis]|uniref:peptidylprolyl isomerase n=1 Tax=Dysgonomonas massiliensis TaxID=2040292 RepID=UPI000C7842CB|nr:peptidylprolyl isomerase [Dysgonomonas massiliensis]